MRLAATWGLCSPPPSSRLSLTPQQLESVCWERSGHTVVSSHSDGSYAIWAPDIIYNPYYEWEDGENGAYMLYLCCSSTWRRSCIAFLVSKEMKGPYTYGDTIVYSGFTKNGETDGNSIRDTS